MRCARGRILDVAVDIRRSSPTFGRHVAVELSAENWRQLLVPIGFAHAFITLEPDCEVLYKTTAPYSRRQRPRASPGTIPAIGIAWPLAGRRPGAVGQGPPMAQAQGRAGPVRMMRIAVTGSKGQVATSLIERAGAKVEIVALGRPGVRSDRPRRRSCRPRSGAARRDRQRRRLYRGRQGGGGRGARDAGQRRGRGACRRGRGAARRSAPASLDRLCLRRRARPRPIARTIRPAPTGAYGRSKLAGEKRVAERCANSVILRTAWVYSPFGANFVRTMLRLNETRDEVGVVADQRGNPTSALDIADALIADRRAGEGGFIAGAAGRLSHDRIGRGDLGGFRRSHISEAAARGRRLTRVKRIATADYPTPARRPANSRLDNEKLGRVYGLRLPEWRQSVAVCCARLLP